MSIVATILGAILGRQQNKEQDNKMEFNNNKRLMQPQPMQGQQSTPIGQVTGQQMPPQQQPATGQGNGFQNGMNKVSTIANILQSLRGASSGGVQNQPYQMQMRRR